MTTNIELYRLCTRPDSEANWNNLRQWMHSNKGDSQRFKEAAEFRNPNPGGYTCFHALVMGYPPLDVIKTLIEYAPKLLTLPDNYGDLPLHSACMADSGPSAEIVSTLVGAYPEGVREVNNDGMLPLHAACSNPCFNKSSLCVLNLLLEAYPESIQIECPSGKPSELLREDWENKFFDFDDDGEPIDENAHRFFLHAACFSGCGYSMHLFKLMLETAPESCMVRNIDGMIPAHFAIACSTHEHHKDWVSMALHLYRACPQSYLVQDNFGRTPARCFKRIASYRDGDGMVLLHRQAMRPEGLAASSLGFLVKAYPESIGLLDNHGKIPFHYACLNPATPLETLILFLKICPESILPNVNVSAEPNPMQVFGTLV